MGICASKSANPSSVVVLQRDSENALIRTEIINPNKDEIIFAKAQKKHLQKMLGKKGLERLPIQGTQVIQRFTISPE